MAIQVDQEEMCTRLIKNEKNLHCNITALSDCNRTHSARLSVITLCVELQMVSIL